MNELIPFASNISKEDLSLRPCPTCGEEPMVIDPTVDEERQTVLCMTRECNHGSLATSFHIDEWNNRYLQAEIYWAKRIYEQALNFVINDDEAPKLIIPGTSGIISK